MSVPWRAGCQRTASAVVLPLFCRHRIEGDGHIELPCNEVHGEEKDHVVAKLSGAARQWWASVVSGGHSFEKPTFQLGLNGWSVTNILPDGAHERTPGRIELLPNGAAGFSQVGDSMCFKLDVSSGLAALWWCVCCSEVLVVRACAGQPKTEEREGWTHFPVCAGFKKERDRERVRVLPTFPVPVPHILVPAGVDWRHVQGAGPVHLQGSGAVQAGSGALQGHPGRQGPSTAGPPATVGEFQGVRRQAG